MKKNKIATPSQLKNENVLEKINNCIDIIVDTIIEDLNKDICSPNRKVDFALHEKMVIDFDHVFTCFQQEYSEDEFQQYFDNVVKNHRDKVSELIRKELLESGWVGNLDILLKKYISGFKIGVKGTIREAKEDNFHDIRINFDYQMFRNLPTSEKKKDNEWLDGLRLLRPLEIETIPLPDHSKNKREDNDNGFE